MERELVIYLIHHNQPELLEAQIRLISGYYPLARFVVGLTCNVNRPTNRAFEMFDTCKRKNLTPIKSDTGETLINSTIQNLCSSYPLRPVVLRIPYMRKIFGQDPSSGHARLLNKLMKHSMGLDIGSEVWFVEGDVLPIQKPERLPEKIDFHGPIYTFLRRGKSHPYINPRIMKFRISQDLIKNYQKGFLDWTPYMGFGFWFDTGSKTFRYLRVTNSKLRGSFAEMDKLVDGQWDQSFLNFQNIKSFKIKKLILEDPRIKIDRKFKYDLYDSTWLHIGKTSGYYDGQGKTLTDQLVSETISALLEN